MRTAALIIPIMLLAFLRSNAQQYGAVRAFPNLRFNFPVDLQHPGDGSNRLFVLEQFGTIKVFENDPLTDTATTFLDIRHKVTAGGEMGLVGLAFHPSYESNGYFYVSYMAPNPLRTVISRFQVSADDPLVADTNSEQIILSFAQPHPTHNGNQIAFGPDGYLYIASGDGGDGGDPGNQAQNTSSPLGKILRIDIDRMAGERNYSIPPDNPFAHDTGEALEELYAYGFRNPWRFSFDPPTGRLWCGDVGQDIWEEIDIVEPGKNYGWRIMEGRHCYIPPIDCDPTGLTMPVWEYHHDTTGGYSVTGGYVYRGPSISALTGKYIYADFVTGKIWALEYDSANTTNTLILDTDFGITSFGIDSRDELYFCTFEGEIYKFTLTSGIDAPSRAGDFTLTELRPNPARSSAIVSYSLERSAGVRLTVHDRLGREMMRVVDGRMDGGKHDVKIDLRGVAAGTYYYRLAVDGNVTTRRMIVIR